MDELLQAALKVWPHSIQPLDMGVEDGIFWATCYAPTVGVNGYVLIPAEGHPWSKGFPTDGEGDTNLDDFLDVHGGVTYYDHANGTKGIWVGFDTCHAFDVWDAEYDRIGLSTRYRGKPHKWDRHWTPELVAEEAKNLARQVAEIARLEATIIDVEE
jgi:hypothetical protein